MALSLTLTYSNETPNSPNYIGTLTDSTTYGGSNAARNTLAVYLVGYKLKSDGTTDTSVNVYSYTPSTATSFTFDILKDGWYQFYYIAVPNYDNTTTYNKYDVQYTSGVVYQFINSTPSSGHTAPNATYWSVVSSPADLVSTVGTATQPGNIAGATPVGGYEVFGQVIYPFSKTAFGNATEDAALTGCTDCEEEEDIDLYEALGVQVDGMNITNQRSKFSKGEQMARYADQLAAKLNV